MRLHHHGIKAQISKLIDQYISHVDDQGGLITDLPELEWWNEFYLSRGRISDVDIHISAETGYKDIGGGVISEIYNFSNRSLRKDFINNTAGQQAFLNTPALFNNKRAFLNNNGLANYSVTTENVPGSSLTPGSGHGFLLLFYVPAVPAGDNLIFGYAGLNGIENTTSTDYSYSKIGPSNPNAASPYGWTTSFPDEEPQRDKWILWMGNNMADDDADLPNGSNEHLYIEFDGDNTKEVFLPGGGSLPNADIWLNDVRSLFDGDANQSGVKVAQAINIFGGWSQEEITTIRNHICARFFEPDAPGKYPDLPSFHSLSDSPFLLPDMFSMFLVNPAYVGNCLRVYRDSDAAELDIGFAMDGAKGRMYLDQQAVIDFAAVNGDDINLGEIKAIKWYNQGTGAGDDFEAPNDVTKMPALVVGMDLDRDDFSAGPVNYIGTNLSRLKNAAFLWGLNQLEADERHMDKNLIINHLGGDSYFQLINYNRLGYEQPRGLFVSGSFLDDDTLRMHYGHGVSSNGISQWSEDIAGYPAVWGVTLSHRNLRTHLGINQHNGLFFDQGPAVDKKYRMTQSTGRGGADTSSTGTGANQINPDIVKTRIFGTASTVNQKSFPGHIFEFFSGQAAPSHDFEMDKMALIHWLKVVYKMKHVQ